MTTNNDKIKRLKELYGDNLDGLEVKRYSPLWTAALDNIMSNEALVRAHLSASLESIVIEVDEVPMEVSEDEIIFRAEWAPWVAEALRQEMQRFMDTKDGSTSPCGCTKCTTERMEEELGRKLDA